MKKLGIFLTGLFLVLSVLTSNAQEKPKAGEFFIGKWKVLVKGAPSGDAIMHVEFMVDEKGKITGTIVDDEGAAPVAKFTRVEAKDKNLTAYWVTQGYDVYLYLEKNGDNEVEGSMMDMFDATGERVIEKEATKK